MTNNFGGRGAVIAAAAAASIVLSGHAHAANFFEQLFGGAPITAPIPSYSDDAPLPDRVVPRAFSRHRRIADDAKPVLQKTTDVMHDKTLRLGDAVMMKGGFTIYEGEVGAHHNPHQFVALDEARVGKATRKILVAMDEAHLGSASTGNTIKEGRSSAEEPPVASGYKITDVRGRSVRYVGP